MKRGLPLLALFGLLFFSSWAEAAEASLPICVPHPEGERDAASFLKTWIATARITLTREPCPLPGPDRYVGRFRERDGTIFFSLATPGGGSLEKVVPWLARLDSPLSDLLQVGRLSEFSVWVEALLAEDRLMTEWQRMLSVPGPPQPGEGATLATGDHAGGATAGQGSARSSQASGKTAPGKAGADAGQGGRAASRQGAQAGAGGGGVGRVGAGAGAQAGGAGSLAGGAGSQAGGAGPQAEGAGSQAGGAGSQAGGAGAQAGGAGAQAGGAGSQAGGAGAQAGGLGSQAGGPGAQAGGGSQVGGAGAQAAATGSLAEGAGSNAEGAGSRAGGAGSNAEGIGSQADVAGSQAEGAGSNAEGPRSRADGIESQAEDADSQADDTDPTLDDTDPPPGESALWTLATGSGFRIRSPDIVQHELAVALSLGPIGLRMGWQPSATWLMGDLPAGIEGLSLEAAWLFPVARGRRWEFVGQAGVAVDRIQLSLLYLSRPTTHVAWDVGPIVGGAFTWRTGSGFGAGVSGAVQWMPTAPITHVGPVGPYGRMNHLGARLGAELSFQK